jgi:hypothetical protein
MTDHHQSFKDRARREAAITRLAAKIGTVLCQATFRHVGEAEWGRVERMQLQLRELRVEAGLAA